MSVGRNLRAVRTRDAKLQVDLSREGATREVSTWFDLARDPGETVDVAAGNDSVARALLEAPHVAAALAQLRALPVNPEPPRGLSPVAPDLRALGYVR